MKSGTFSYKIPAHTSQTFIEIHQEHENPIEASWQFDLEAGSSLILCPIIVGNANLALTINASLEENAQLMIVGAYALKGTQSCLIITKQEHKGASSTSNLVINGIAKDQASLQYQGAIFIQKNAAQSIAKQENKTLLLGSQARAISIPSLEILNNDVQCAHGSAVGPLQEDQLIYAQSRGLPLKHAQKLLITSFFAQTLGDILDENLKAQLIEKLVQRSLGEKNERHS